MCITVTFPKENFLPGGGELLDRGWCRWRAWNLVERAAKAVSAAKGMER
jgi:hypothetical protein